MAWLPVPEPVTWQMSTPIVDGGMTYSQVVCRAPTGEDIMKSTALAGTNADITHRLIEAVSGVPYDVPYDVLKRMPWWMILQMSEYMDEFAGAPAPDPLEAWRKARGEAAIAEANLAKPPVPTEVTEVS